MASNNTHQLLQWVEVLKGAGALQWVEILRDVGRVLVEWIKRGNNLVSWYKCWCNKQSYSLPAA